MDGGVFMKKLITLLLVSLFCFGLFAHPKIPKGGLLDNEGYILIT